MKRALNVVWMVVLGAVLGNGCGCGEGKHLKKFHEEKILLGAFVQVDVCAPANEAVAVEQSFHDVWDRLAQIDQRMNVYDSSSDVAMINAAAGKPVAVHPDVREVIRQTIEFSRLTDGMFDITVRPLIVLWKQAAETRQLPDAAALKNTLQDVGFDKIIFNSHDEVQLKGAAQLDLSGIGQGYAADEAARILRSAGW
ncbi:MAG TPA: FAD:protein FMN transferase, partial [Candidatus Bathyarchaeia archaeon]|nr:FAD:protein FMN transferase [Candidatus Bathyarchaeia archaeon]